MERHFILSKDQLAESERQKTKENVIPRGKSRPVENDLKGYFSLDDFYEWAACNGQNSKK